MTDNNSIDSQISDTDDANEESTEKRRDFLRNSALAAGAVATFAVAESATAQTYYDDAGNALKATSGKQVIDVAFNNADLVLDDVYSIIKQLGRLTGCFNCGFNGYDLRFRIDPVIKLDSRVPVAATLMHG